MKTISLIFTRDFDQWIQEMVRNSLVIDCPKIWGRGLKDQIVRFDGKTFEWYRYDQDMTQLKDFMIRKPLSDKIYQLSSQRKFIDNVNKLKKYFELSSLKIKDPKKIVLEIKKIFKEMYPYYPLGIFICGPWRDDFLKYHGKKGKKILDLLYQSRVKSEGLLKLTGLFLRKLLSPHLAQHNCPVEYARLLNVNEVENLISIHKLPAKKILAARNKGYIYYQDKILPISNFNQFIKAHGLAVSKKDEHTDSTSLKGTVAYGQGIITGCVQKIFNTFEASDFKKGYVLVTPMTSPEYLGAIKQAKAVITNEGGITCHAAIVARELKKPCVIGTKIATRVFKDGDLVEVDANKGVVRKIK